ncbi:MAG: hypothetical protein ACKPE6_03760 [Gammaproteobacteria bacterium]
MARTSTSSALLSALLSGLLLASTVASAAPVSIEQSLTSGWSGGFCSPCNGAVKLSTRYFASFSVQEGATFSGASFAVSQNALLGYVTSFSVSIWRSPIDGELLHEALFDPGDYVRNGLPAGTLSGRCFIDVLLPDWFLNPFDYWISLYAPGASISWGSDGRAGDDRGYTLKNGAWEEIANDPYLGFSLRGKTGPSTVPIGGTLPLLLAGLAALAVTRRRAPLG